MTTLLVAATGGHLAQLNQLYGRLVDDSNQVVWATFDTPQSRSLLRDQTVEFVPYTAPRAYLRVALNTRRALAILRKYRVTRVISTGSGIALSFLPVARLLGIETLYVESAARSDGPSTTGRLLALVPGIQLATQYAGWATRRWRPTISVFDQYVQRPLRSAHQPQRIVVTLGTIEGYGFRRLIDRLIEIIPPDVAVVWQTGETDVSGLPIATRASMPMDELLDAIKDADAVIAHAGIGSALSSLNAGRQPILVPRRAAAGEHVDDHQLQIARELDSRGLAIYREVGDLSWADVIATTARQIVRR